MVIDPCQVECLPCQLEEKSSLLLTDIRLSCKDKIKVSTVYRKRDGTEIIPHQLNCPRKDTSIAICLQWVALIGQERYLYLQPQGTWESVLNGGSESSNSLIVSISPALLTCGRNYYSLACPITIKVGQTVHINHIVTDSIDCNELIPKIKTK